MATTTIAPYGAILVQGPDAVRWLQGQLTADVTALSPGATGGLAALLDVTGHLIT